MPKPEEHTKHDELSELMEELRVVLPGVEVLFAFLLTVPFSERFTHINDSERILFFIAFMAAAAASICLIAPSSIHRLNWRQDDEEYVMRISTRLAVIGVSFLAAAISAVVFLITTLLFGNAVAAGTTAIIVAAVAWLWFGLPITRRMRS